MTHAILFYQITPLRFRNHPLQGSTQCFRHQSREHSQLLRNCNFIHIAAKILPRIRKAHRMYNLKHLCPRQVFCSLRTQQKRLRRILGL